MTPMAKKQQDDPAAHKGAIEGDRPTDEQQGNPNGDGVNDEGLPDRDRGGRDRRERRRVAGIARIADWGERLLAEAGDLLAIFTRGEDRQRQHRDRS
jgi:hypothetical protein